MSSFPLDAILTTSRWGGSSVLAEPRRVLRLPATRDAPRVHTLTLALIFGLVSTAHRKHNPVVLFHRSPWHTRGPIACNSTPIPCGPKNTSLRASSDANNSVTERDGATHRDSMAPQVGAREKERERERDTFR